MAGMSNQIRGQVSNFFNSLSMRQRLMIIISFVAALAVLIVVMVWTARPNFDVLFSNLAEKDAGAILDKLREQKIPFQLENGGGTILVPTDKVYELRLKFAQEGLPASSNVGYEIFDKTNLGMTDFIQQVNYRRALEGELARTIEQIDLIERARVHIVIPKDALFKEDQKEATASVILKLKGRGTPSKATIQGITHLISSSVEGLEPQNITVLDTRGKVLSDPHDPNDLVALSSTQLEYTKKVEDYLVQKAQSMLDQVVGPGNAVVRVTAQLNFRKVEKSTEEYDPDNPVVVSEEISEESSPVASADLNNSARNDAAAKSSTTVTNYELSKTVQHIVEGVGTVERLSVAVMINNKKQIVTTEDGKKTIKYTPRSPEELKMLTDLVRTAVGYQRNRGDQVSVVNVDFSVPGLEEEFLETDKNPFWDNWYDLVEKVFLILAIVAAMLLMRSLFGQVKKRSEEIQKQIQILKKKAGYLELPEASEKGAGKKAIKGQEDMAELPEGLDEDTVIHAENFFKSVQKQDAFTQNLRQFVHEKPEQTATLMKVWLSEDEND
ncbi:MAG: hypothetical protein Kow0037_19980 [Calditrichia bacterium]